MASEQESDEVWGLLQRARRELDELATMVRNHVGIDWGGTSINSPHPSIPIPYREIHGPSRESVDATHDMSFVVDFDESVITLHKASLSFRVRAVRSNVSASSSSSSSGGGTTATSTSGGGQTSSSGGAHTHTVTNHQHTVSIAAHTHSISAASTSVPKGTNGTELITMVSSVDHSVGSGSPTPVATQAQSTSHTHNETGSVTGLDNSNHTHSLNDHKHYPTHSLTTDNLIVATDSHNHDITASATQSGGSTSVSSAAGGGQTSSSDGAHAHTVSNHTHDVTVAAHSHTITTSLTYGIYEGPAPVNPNVSIVINGVDVTAALGGPWDTDATLDITSYLREESGDPLRQANTIVLSSDELIDLEVVCKSLVSAASPLAIGAPAL